MSVSVRALIIFLGSFLFSASALAIEDTWHVALGAGLSTLKPDTSESGLTLKDDQSTAAGINLGLDINPVITAELAFTDLGSASLSGDRSVDYQALSLGAVAYVWGEKEAHFRQEGLSAYVRLGLSAIENESEIMLRKSNNTALWLGAGVQWPVSPRWSVRAEVSSFDGDARAVMASVVWRNADVESNVRFGSQSDDRDTAQNSTSNNTSTQSSQSAAVPQATTTPEISQQPLPQQTDSARVQPSTQSGSGTTVQRSCFSSSMQADVNQRACSLLNGELAGLDFKPNTSQITLLGRASLDRVANALKQYPRVVVELQVHTQSFAEEGLANKLSRERVVNVARYLAGRGIPVRQLRARAYGSANPRADNGSAAGRRANNRVEIKLL